MMHKCSVRCGIILAFALTACGANRWDADVSKVNYSGGFARLDQAVFAIKPNEPLSGHDSLTALYGEVYSDYIEDIMRIGEVNNPMTASLLMRFTTDPMWAGLQSHLTLTYPNLDAAGGELELALKRYAVLLNDDALPRLVAYNSGFNVGIYPSDHWLGVGLEWYAGTDHRWVKQLPPDLFPQYKRDKMQPQYLVPNALRGWLLYRFREKIAGEDLLSEMVFAGKAAYLTCVLLGYEDEQKVMNFTDAQMEWCRKNEFDLWKHLVERDIVFIKDPMELNKMMNDGPFTPGMPMESPGGVGRWIGYRMVYMYMERHPDTDLVQLMNHRDHRALLKYYKPGR